jgi:hypothetical protein
MEEKSTFTSRLKEECINRYFWDREMLISNLEGLITEVNNVGFEIASLSSLSAKVKNRITAAILGLPDGFGREEEVVNVTSWHENPRHNYTRLLYRLIDVIKTADTTDLRGQVEVVIQEFEAENPELDYKFFLNKFKFLPIIKEIVFAENVDSKSILTVFLRRMIGVQREMIVNTGIFK